MKKYLVIVLVFGIQSFFIQCSWFDGLFSSRFLTTEKYEQQKKQAQQQVQEEQLQKQVQPQQQVQEEQLQKQVQQLSQSVKHLEYQLMIQRYKFLQQQQEVYYLRQQLDQKREEEERQRKSSWFEGVNFFSNRFIDTREWEERQRKQQRQEQLQEEKQEQQGLLLTQLKPQQEKKGAESQYEEVSFLPTSEQLQLDLAQLQNEKQVLESQLKKIRLEEINNQISRAKEKSKKEILNLESSGEESKNKIQKVSEKTEKQLHLLRLELRRELKKQKEIENRLQDLQSQIENRKQLLRQVEPKSVPSRMEEID